MKVAIRCANVNHQGRHHLPGWENQLGTVEVAQASAGAVAASAYICGACTDAYRAAWSAYGLAVAAAHAAEQAHLPSPDPGPPPDPLMV